MNTNLSSNSSYHVYNNVTINTSPTPVGNREAEYYAPPLERLANR